MPVLNKMKASGGSLIVLTLLQGPTVYSAERPATSGVAQAALTAVGQAQCPAKTNPEIISQSTKLVSAIAELEKRYFEHDFHSEAPGDRLTRLEQLLFGAAKQGSVEERLKSAQLASVAEKQSTEAASVLEQELKRLESHFFQHDFQNDSKEQRIARLEELAFGLSKTGSIEERLKSIKSALGGAWQSTSLASKPKETSGAAKANKQTTSFSFAMQNGIDNFKNQRYHHAQDDFEKAISLNPRSAEAYANLAGTLLMLSDKQGANDAFKACYQLHPFGKLGSYAREQLLKLSREEAYTKTDPQDSPKTVAQTVQTINRQSADRSRMYQAQASRTAQYRLNLADIEVQKLSSATQQALYDLRANRGYYTYSRYGMPHYHGGAYNPYDGQDISNMGYIGSNYLRTDGQMQANLAMTDGYTRSASVFESGTNLKDQILQPVGPGGARLRALGTSLYARYYGNGMPSANDPPLLDPAPAALEASAKSLSR